MSEAQQREASIVVVNDTNSSILIEQCHIFLKTQQKNLINVDVVEDFG